MQCRSPCPYSARVNAVGVVSCFITSNGTRFPFYSRVPDPAHFRRVVKCETATVTLGHSKILVITGLSSNLLRTLCVRESELDADIADRRVCVTRAKPLDREALVQPPTTGTRLRPLLPRRSLFCREPK